MPRLCTLVIASAALLTLRAPARVQAGEPDVPAVRMADSVSTPAAPEPPRAAIPSPGRRLGLMRVRPNPAIRGRMVTVTVDLPDAQPARVELLDASGRRTGISEEVSGPGRVDMELEGLSRVAPGRYILRLVHPTRSRSRTIIVLP